MGDRELLEWAAKAAGYTPAHVTNDGVVLLRGVAVRWDPLADDGDALRLMTAVQVEPEFRGDQLWVNYAGENAVHEFFRDDKFAAVRRAIVRAAAAIAQQKEAANG